MSDGRKILIIDDETDLCLLLKEYFVRKNYEVIVSHTLQEGKVLLTENKPDILFLDNNLPDGIGWTEAPLFAKNLEICLYAMVQAKFARPEQTEY